MLLFWFIPSKPIGIFLQALMSDYQSPASSHKLGAHKNTWSCCFRSSAAWTRNFIESFCVCSCLAALIQCNLIRKYATVSGHSRGYTVTSWGIYSIWRTCNCWFSFASYWQHVEGQRLCLSNTRILMDFFFNLFIFYPSSFVCDVCREHWMWPLLWRSWLVLRPAMTVAVDWC